MHVASILTLGLVFMMLLRGCEAADAKLWNMRLPEEDKPDERLMDMVQEGDETASQSASDSWRGNPGDKKWTHLKALADKNEDLKLWDQLGKRKESPEESGVCHNEERRVYLLYRQFANSLRGLVKEKVKVKYGESIGWTNDFVVGVRLDSEKLRVMEKFGADEHFSVDSLYNAHEAMTSMLLYVNFPQHESKSWMEKFVGCTPLQAAIFLVGLLFLLIVPKLLWYILCSRRLTWKFVIVISLLVSFGWKGYAMYLRERVNTEVALSHNYGQACLRPASFWQQIAKGLFSANDECHDFHYHTMIDPIWKISPSKISAEVVMECLWMPLQTAGKPIAIFVKDLFSEMPFYLWPVAGVVALIMMLLMYTLITGCELRLVFGIIHIGARPSAIEALLHDERAELETLRIEAATLRQKALLQSQREAIEMNAGGDARPANRLRGVPPQKAIKGARHKKGREHIGNGSAAGSSHEYSDEPRDADNIGPRSSTVEVRRRSTEARSGQGDPQNSTNHNGSRDRTCGCHLDTESASSEESDDGPENQASRTPGMNFSRPVTVTRSLDNEDLCE